MWNEVLGNEPLAISEVQAVTSFVRSQLACPHRDPADGTMLVLSFARIVEITRG
jgi:hypothetical protein